MIAPLTPEQQVEFGRIAKAFRAETRKLRHLVQTAGQGWWLCCAWSTLDNVADVLEMLAIAADDRQTEGAAGHGERSE